MTSSVRPSRIVRHGSDITAVRADNPGPLTLTGTKTYVIGTGPVIVLDSGPQDEAHLGRVDEVIAGRPVAAVCLTHAHADHSASAAAASARWGELRAAAATLDRLEWAGRALADGEAMETGEGLRLRAVPTPGHSADHLCYLLEPSRALFTGDLVLGEGSTMIAHPDGSVGAYLASLARLAALRPGRLFPGHGPAVGDALARLEECRAHRHRRVAAVRRALEAGARTPARIRAAVYGDLPASHHAAADLTIRAYLAFLEETSFGETSSSISRRR
ncbi:MBL fold metallo-hydrolase [Candidatus Palauibacter sp.]|uniref:MBL fold metallo-hydrolase n=1 Tax=Candidatus Palauibacter sp. TaxID=3101350 RepID=UPI003B5267DA